MADKKIPIGVSSCLLGHEVRHDGGHKRNRYILDKLDDFFEFQPFCPEVAAGLGTPRPAFRLSRNGGEIRMVDSRQGTQDITDNMQSVSSRAAARLQHLSGYILKKDSPSCGMERVRIYNETGQPEKNGRGLFAQALIEAYPELPVEEEGRLIDPTLRENFIQRVFVYRRWQELIASGLSVGTFRAFHQQHKFILLAHDETTYRQLGPQIASVTTGNLDHVSKTYISGLMDALAKPATRKRHTNVLMHLAGYFKQTLTTDEKAELQEVLDYYRQGLVPLVVPITMVKHFQRRHQHPYLNTQYYLNPYPEALMLRNHV